MACSPKAPTFGETCGECGGEVKIYSVYFTYTRIKVDGFGSALLGAVVLTLLNLLVMMIFGIA